MKSIKKLLTIGLTTAALSSFSIAAQAWEPTFYAGSNVSSAQHKKSDYEHHFSILSVEGLGGINLLPHLSAEVRLGIGYNEDRIDKEHGLYDEDGAYVSDSPEHGDDLRANYYASIYLRPHYSNETASIYALIGGTTAEVSSNYSILEDSDTGFSVGVGVSFVMSDKVDITAEWKKQIQTQEFNIQGASLGFVYSF